MCGVIGGLLGSLVGAKSPSIETKTVAAPTTLDVGKESLAATQEAKKKAAAASGAQSTIATSSQGDTSQATTSKKTLLGA